MSEGNGLSPSGRILQVEGPGHSNGLVPFLLILYKTTLLMHSTHGIKSFFYTYEGGIQKVYIAEKVLVMEKLQIHSNRKTSEENSGVNGSWNHNGGQVPFSTEKVKAAAKAGLAAAATKAKLFADLEEREIQRLSANIINHQVYILLKRLELKLKQFAEVETFLVKECEQVERTRQRFATERVRVLSTRFGPAGFTSSMSLPDVSPIGKNNTSNNKQQILSASPSQPSIPGFGNNQPVHPHMPFIPCQQMFGLGPRLPVEGMKQYSSTSNAMFNTPGNAQPTLNHLMLRPVSGTTSGLG
ncbi:SWI/SNF complex subunit SWI3C-like [Juglans microcarpa x Juglans regia]|uniref:SWI/SNF complex subunit SWI3C-like n=1 Tax=Juglans microcarpa x Juglans regia TaxID=2249226 RepID=UPI001B7DC9B2|nr:SWI/SNF complex subunit SWI3C-like [Juglans microcarpa x Juglans regia]